jgi:hypothetical protein
MIDVSSRTLSVALIQLLAAFGDNSLQFVGFLARERTGGAVDDGVTFLIGDELEAMNVVGSPLQVGRLETLQILNGRVKLGHPLSYLGQDGFASSHSLSHSLGLFCGDSASFLTCGMIPCAANGQARCEPLSSVSNAPVVGVEPEVFVLSIWCG